MSWVEIAWLRTSCLLIRTPEGTAITDPWFGRTMRGLPVFRKPAIPLEKLPKIDVVIGSHLHRDHFDPKAVARFGHPRMLIAGCPGTEDFVRQHVQGPYQAVHDVPQWTSRTLGPFTLHATPADHTGPPPPEVNYVIDVCGLRLFFGGDARMSPHYAEAAARFPGIDVALLPIGGTLIFGTRTTLSPADAVEVCSILKPRFAVPIHEGGEWLPVPPASWHPGRTIHFEEQLRAAGGPTEPARLRPGQWARFTKDGMTRLGAA